MSLFRSIATVSSLTLASRITGFIRDVLIAAFLGAGMVADAFFVAFRLPNLFRSLFAEGAFNVAFVPLFAGKMEQDGREAARLFAEQAMAVLFWGLAFFIAFMEIIMPWAIYIIAPGFTDVAGKMNLAVEFSRLTFPYLLFISLVSLQGGILNSYNRFAAPAAMATLSNVVLTGGMIALAPYTATAGHALSWSLTFSGVIQFICLTLAMRRTGIVLRPRFPRLSPEIRQLFKRITPGIVGAGVYQLNLLVSTLIASLAPEGTISMLYYADRINQLPFGLIGVAISTALLPLLSRQFRAGDLDAAYHNQNRALELGLLLTLPAATSLLILSTPIIQVLFERGSFGPSQTSGTAAALSVFALGLPALVLSKILTPSFFARGDTKTPVKIAIASIICNILLSFILVKPLAHVGLAFASSASAWTSTILLLITLHRRNLISWDAHIRKHAPRIILATALFLVFLYAAKEATIFLELGSTTTRILWLGMIVISGIAIFSVLASVCGAMKWSEVKTLLRRR